MSFVEALAARFGAGVAHGPAELDLTRHMADTAMAAPAGTEILGVAYPRSTDEVARIVASAAAEGISIVPQGGMSGLAGGGVPFGRCLVIALERMNAIEAIEPMGLTMTVQAGAILQNVQDAAKRAGLFFPVDLGGRGSAQIGGMIATNAGGNRVLRYGMMRDQVLGLEVVLADGTVLPMLNAMLKNNSGYDLKHVFIGAEGTLGIVTRAVLRLAPEPSGSATVLCAVRDYAAVLALLAASRKALGPALGSFEVMWPDFYELGTTAVGRTPPIAAGHGLYVLIEALWQSAGADEAPLVELVEDAAGRGIVDDAVVATSLRQSDALWAIRDATGEFPRTLGPQIGFDISIPTARIGDFVAEHRDLMGARWPRARLVYFGHVADGNLHIAVGCSGDAGQDDAMERATYDRIGAWGGAVSAEHGIGAHKMPFLHHSRSPAEMATMRLLKRALDPGNVMNPGKVFDL